MNPFPDGESYDQVARRVSTTLAAIAHDYVGPVLIVGHRATFYALEHLVRGVPLRTTIEAAWAWQPGWEYELPCGFRAKA